MSKSNRGDIVSSETKSKPGPGNYESPSKIGTGISYKFGEKHRDAVDSDIPGPGSYEPKDSLNKDTIPAHSISKSHRGDIVSRENLSMPGPGNYESPSRIGTGISYKFGEKHRDVVDSDIPGPGSYEPKDTLNKDAIRAHSISKSNRGDLVSKSAK